MSESERRHPREHVGCAECNAGYETWAKNRELPQIGQTYECTNCEHEVFVYDAGGTNETIKQWRPVRGSMVDSLQEFAEEEA